MAIAAFNPTNLQMTQWSSEVQSLWKGRSIVKALGLAGGSKRSPIYDLSFKYRGQPGVTFRCPLVRPASGAGVTNSTALTGNESQPVLSNTDIVQTLRRNGFQAPGEYEQKKSNIDFGGLFRDQMEEWCANMVDYDFFAAIKQSLVYTTQHIVAYPSGATDVAGINAGKVLTVAQVRKAAALASIKSVAPIMLPGFGEVDGVLLVTPEQMLDLQNDDEWVSMHENAGVRGESNALFTIDRYVRGRIDNVLVIRAAALAGAYPTTKLGGSHLYTETQENYNRAEAIFLGASAVGLVDEYDFMPITPDDKDWDDQIGFGGKTFMGFAKNVIDMATDPTVGHAQTLRDYATVYVPTAATPLG